MMRGAWSCTLTWLTGVLQACSLHEVRDADEVDRKQRFEARKKGHLPRVGIPHREAESHLLAQCGLRSDVSLPFGIS